MYGSDLRSRQQRDVITALTGCRMASAFSFHRGVTTNGEVQWIGFIAEAVQRP